MNTQMPDPRASFTEKQDKQWYIPMADFVIALATSSSPKTTTRRFLNAANGILDKKDYAYVMKTYTTDNEATEVEADLDSSKLGSLRDVDILTPIKDRYMGEFISSYHNYQVYANDSEIVLKRNKALGQRVVAKMFEKLQQILSSSDGSNNIDINSFIEKELEDWKNSVVEKEQSALELLNTEIEARRKYVDAYFYWFACEEVYTHRRLSGNDVKFEVISPLEFYRVDSGNYFVEDDHYCLRRYSITLQEIIDEFYNNMENGLSDRQLSLIKKMIASSSSGYGMIDRTIFLEYKDFFPDGYNFNADIKFTKKGLQTTVDHYVFKTEIKKGILTYRAIDGTISEMDVDEDYELDTTHGDISIEWKWIDQTWEGWRFGDGNNFQLYIPPRPVDLPRELLTNSSVCKLPYNGISYIHKESVRKPIPYRIKDHIALYKIYTLLEERWLNKFKSWLLLPESILNDSEEMKLEDRLQQADIDGLLPFNDVDIRENPNAVNYFKEIATTAVIKFSEILHQVKDSIKQNAWEVANMNDERFGQTNKYKGKGVTEYDYNQAMKSTVWSLEMFNSFRERDYMANLDYSRAAWIDGKQGSYVDPTTGEIKYVDIDGEDHLGADMGLFITNSAELNSQAESLKQLAFNASQNDSQDIAAEAVTNKNIAKLKNIIKEAVKAKRDFDLKMSTAKEEALAKANQIQLQNDREKRQHELDMLDREIERDYGIKRIDSETKISIEDARLQVDTNGNGYIDKAEADNANPGVIDAKERARGVLDQRKQALGTMKMGIDNLKNARQLARQKATQKTK